MKRATLQEGVEFNLFETTGSALALFVASRHIARSRFPLSLRFRAFKDNDFSWHNCVFM